MAFAVADTTSSYSLRAHLGRPSPWLQIFRMAAVAYAIWGIVLTPLVVAICRRVPLARPRLGRAIALNAAAAVGIALINAALRLPFHNFVYPGEHMAWPPQYVNYLLANGLEDVWTYGLVASVWNCINYYRQYKGRELVASRLEAELANARLEMLKRQLHPHFLFNTLHSISELMHQDVDAADRMLVRLSDLLRITLENTGTQHVALSAELQFVRGYLDIEKARFQDRLIIVYEVAPETLDAKIPSMLLQPLAENAIKHGVQKRSGIGSIELAATRKGPQLILRMRDNGAGAHVVPDSERTSSNGVGLSATRARLQHLYGERHQLKIFRPAEGGFEVSIALPFERIAQASPTSTQSFISCSA
jgi:two-component system, LytTR family, sensor kinase